MFGYGLGGNLLVYKKAGPYYLISNEYMND